MAVWDVIKINRPALTGDLDTKQRDLKAIKKGKTQIR